MKRMRSLLIAGSLLALGVAANGDVAAQASDDSTIYIDIVSPISMEADDIELGLHHINTDLTSVSNTGTITVSGGTLGYSVALAVPATVNLVGAGNDIPVNLSLGNNNPSFNGSGVASTTLQATVANGTSANAVGEYSGTVTITGDYQ